MADCVFDPTTQVYLCLQGKILTRKACNQTNRYRVYDVYRAQERDCTRCRVHPRCLSKPDALRRNLLVEVQSRQPSLTKQMKARIDMPEGKQIYARRLAIVEPVFANLRVQRDWIISPSARKPRWMCSGSCSLWTTTLVKSTNLDALIERALAETDRGRSPLSFPHSYSTVSLDRRNPRRQDE